MGGLGSGSGFRITRTRTKEFVEGRKYITARSFPFSLMKTVSRNKISHLVYGISLEIYPTYLFVFHEETEGKIRGLQIHLEPTKTHFGNCRYWFRCPSQGCDRRCGKLYLQYLPNGKPAFICRKCLNLAYASQNTSCLDRLLEKKWKILRKLQAEVAGAKKPKGMWHKTYDWLQKELKELEDTIFWGGIQKYGF